MDIGQVRKQFSIMLVNTIRELRGETCIPLDNAPAPKKQIVVSRTFGKRVTELDFLEEAVSDLSLIHISEPTRRTPISYAVFCLKKKNQSTAPGRSLQ